MQKIIELGKLVQMAFKAVDRTCGGQRQRLAKELHILCFSTD